MADSVDRVFSHALNTVNKIRTGSQKPPSATRLQLYGLYKQAMEGDVDGIMERPEGSSDEVHRAREKWDAWKQQNGLSRTEAKRRYITTLIDTMHKYASPSADSRELVAELEFVWDQVKSNVPSSSSSSPIQTLGSMGLHMPPHYPHLGSRTTFNTTERTSREQQRTHDDEAQDDDNRPLQIKSPMSQSEEDLEEDEADMDRDEFVDAPDSQYNPTSEDAAVQANLTPQEPIPYATPKKPILKSIALIPTPSAPPPAPQQESAADAKWRKRVEQALVKMTAEVAALREQLESRRLFSHSPRYVFFRSIWRFIWGSLKHIAIDVLILGLVLLYLRRKKDRRLEAGVRLLLGDAKAQVQKVGGAQLVKVKIPGLGGKKT